MSTRTPIEVHVRVRPYKSSDGLYTDGHLVATDRVVSGINKGQRFQYRRVSSLLRARMSFRAHSSSMDCCHGPESSQQDVFEKMKHV